MKTIIIAMLIVSFAFILIYAGCISKCNLSFYTPEQMDYYKSCVAIAQKEAGRLWENKKIKNDALEMCCKTAR